MANEESRKVRTIAESITLRSTLADTPAINLLRTRGLCLINDGAAAELTAYHSLEDDDNFRPASELDVSLGEQASASVPAEVFSYSFVKFVSSVDNLPVRISGAT